MPIDYRIDPERRMVWAKARGTMTHQDVFGYQREVWSRPDVAGFSELMDMTDVENIAPPSGEQVRTLANVSAHMDPPASSSKFAIMAPGDLAYALGRMYQVYREVPEGSTKQVGVFRTMQAALEWLGVEGTGPCERVPQAALKP